MESFDFLNGELLLKYTKYPFEDCSRLYQVAVNDDGVFIRSRDNDGTLSSFKKTTYETIENEYIPLIDYLMNTDYLGLPASINCTKWNNVQQIINGVVLYKTPAYLLVYDMEPTNLAGKTLPFKVINSDDFVSYTVTGEKTDIYIDPKELYHDLFIEILETTKDMNNKGKQK